eukprot:TRINITY_DN60721_c0_g1_i1.p1 TRINITY_DN60721_c0_g1~~TRINITY_DN60721_c0_g1_i1.p1  ORF type:complete len:302 (-),score=74.06 TRINITY_DN60721_c0_g1_i1:66-971(-)
MARHLQGKVAVITGSGQGLGKAFASKLLNEGAKVCLSDVREDTGLGTLKEFSERFGQENVHFVKCDVTKDEEIVNLYESCEAHFNKKVDIFCNNAGINHVLGWRKCMQIDIMAVMAGTEIAMERMSLDKGGNGGLIVNTASLAGIVKGFGEDSSSYFVAKHGVVTLTRTLGQDVTTKKNGIQHMCICPAFADTAIIENVGVSREALEKRAGIMTPEFVADCFLKLVKTGRNGDAMVVMKNIPPFMYGDHSMLFVKALAVGAKMTEKLLGGAVFSTRHQAGLLVAVSALALFLLYIFIVLIL